MKYLKVFGLVLLAMFVVACGNDNETIGSGKKEELNLKENISDNLYVYVDDVKYELNTVAYATFAQNGWKLEEGYVGRIELDPGEMRSVKLIHDTYDENAYIRVYFLNEGTNTVNHEGAEFAYFYYSGVDNIDNEYILMENVPDITLPGNVKFGATKEEVEEIYGEPNNVYGDEELFGLTYSYGSIFTTGYIKLTFLKDFGLCEIEMYRGVNL